MNSLVKLLRELGEDKTAEKIIDNFIEAHKDKVEIFDLSKFRGYGDKFDQKIISKFELIIVKSFGGPSLEDLLIKLAEDGYLEEKGMFHLARTSHGEFLSQFRAKKGAELNKIIKGVLSLGSIINRSDDASKVFETVNAALVTLGKESKINSLRMSRFGIQIPVEVSSASGGGL